MSCTSKAERAIIAALKATGLPYEIKEGGKHEKIYLAGKFIGVMSNAGKFIGVMSNAGNSGRGRDEKGILCAIKRRLRELEA